jgi:hypothetical protein
MKHQRHFDASAAALKEAVQVRKVIVDLDRTVQIRKCEVAAEEERARVFNLSDSAYPILARTVAARRDNLRDTIAALEQRLTTIKAPFVEAGAAWRNKPENRDRLRAVFLFGDVWGSAHQRRLGGASDPYRTFPPPSGADPTEPQVDALVLRH